MLKQVFPHYTEDLVSLTIDNVSVTVPAGITVAAAILHVVGHSIRTTPVSGEKRAPYCHMGVCFECVAEVNGKQNVQTCLVRVESGMEVVTYTGAPRLLPVQNTSLEEPCP